MAMGKHYKPSVIVFLENRYIARHGALSLHHGLMACPDTEKPLPYRAGYSEKKTETITKDARALSWILVRATRAP